MNKRVIIGMVIFITLAFMGFGYAAMGQGEDGQDGAFPMMGHMKAKHAELEKILTDEQMATLRAFRDERREGPDGEGPHPRHGDKGMIGMLAELAELERDLNLTDEQVAQLDAIQENARARLEPVMDEMKSWHDIIREESEAEVPDEASIREAAAGLGASIGEAAVIKTQIQAECRKVLTPEQSEIMKRFKENHEGHRRGGPGPEMGGGPDKMMELRDLVHDLNLTDEQIESLKAMDKSRPEHKRPWSDK